MGEQPAVLFVDPKHGQAEAKWCLSSFGFFALGRGSLSSGPSRAALHRCSGGCASVFEPRRFGERRLMVAEGHLI
jgi:hypothetical protein